MSRCYDMHVEIKDYTPDKSNAIQSAANSEWDAFADDWSTQSNLLSACGEGSLCGGESEDEFAARLTHAIWRANGAFCDITVIATYLQDLPCEIYTLSSEDYESFIASADIALSSS